jgi:chromosome segregation ATPase
LADSDDPSIKLESMTNELKQNNAEVQRLTDDLTDIKHELNTIIQERNRQKLAITILKEEVLRLRQTRSKLMDNENLLLIKLKEATSNAPENTNREEEVKRLERVPATLPGIDMLIKAVEYNVNVIQFSVRDFLL